MSRYQKGKTNLDFTEARDSEWQWHRLGHIQVYISLQTDNHASTPLFSVSALYTLTQNNRPVRQRQAIRYSLSVVRNVCRRTILAFISVETCSLILYERYHSLTYCCTEGIPNHSFDKFLFAVLELQRYSLVFFDHVTNWLVLAVLLNSDALKRFYCSNHILGPDLQNTLLQSNNYLTIMPKLRSTYDERLIYKASDKERKAYLGTIHSRNCKIV